jgi:hypothetical protein
VARLVETASPSRIARLFARPAAGKAAPLLAALFALTTIPIGFYSDDWSQIAHLQGRAGSAARGAWDLYRFADGDPAHLRALQVDGPIPWFADPHLKLAFLRPLSSLLLALDFKVFGLHPLGWHLHAALWYAALVALVAAILRRALPGSRAVANLAACIYAVDVAHVEPVGWLASRHMLVGVVPALGALWLHLAGREGRARLGRWLAPLALAIGLAGSESSLGVVGLLAAYELLGPPRARAAPIRERLAALAPYALVLAAYVVVYKANGYGAAASAAYLDPASAPLRFAIAIADRAPMLLANLFFEVPSDLTNVVSHLPFWIAGGVGLLGFGALFRSIARDLGPSERVALAWLVPGGLFALVAALGGYPGARVLILPSLASAAFFAVVLVRALDGSTRAAERLGRRLGRGLVFLLHVVLAPLLFIGAAAGVADISRKMFDAAVHAELGPHPEGARAIILAASDPFAGFYVPAPLAVTGHPTPKAWQLISMAKTTHRITRVAADRLRVRCLDAPMMQGSFERVFRAPSNPFSVGDRVDLDGVSVVVTEVAAGAPREVELTVFPSVDDESVLLLAFRDGKLRRLPRLAIGTSIDIPWSPGPTGLF